MTVTYQHSRERSRAYWDRWFGRARKANPMGDRRTYRMAVEFLDQPGWTLEDWGGGLGYAARYVHQASYLLVDGSAQSSPKVRTKVAELTEYRSAPEAILMRHVLEHNPGTWQAILDNALASFQQRMVLVLFTPYQPVTRLLTEGPGVTVRVPTLGFARQDIVGRFPAGVSHREEQVGDWPETLHYLTR